MADEGAAKAVLAAIGAGAVQEVAVEEEGVAGLHAAGNGLLAWGRGDEMAGE